MKRSALILLGLLVGSAAIAAGLSIAFGSDERSDPPRVDAAPNDAPLVEARPGESERDLARREREALEALWDRDYPMHGVVTAAQLNVRATADPDAPVIGWLRLGGRVRLKNEPQRTATCATGWYELYPRGFACAGQGIEVAAQPPAAAANAADTESALPYRYYVAREPQVPEYHRLPSRDEQRDALTHGQRYVQLLSAGDERRAQALREGRLPNEPPYPTVVSRYLERGFYIASNASEVRSRRRFVRTVRGSYVKEAQLLESTGSPFAGVELEGEVTLPIAWAVRAARPMRRLVRADGTERFVDDETMPPVERQTRIEWLRRERLGTHEYHVLPGPDGEPRYLRAWFIAVAERIDPPRRITGDEPWVHVDRGEQTLVVYRGRTPIYATLVSSGLAEHETPIGEFSIRRKFVSDTMANLGPDAGDDSYRIDDVPWTQYFDGAIALHGAFWHHRFGLQRSHGCVNLAPRDARYVFEHTWPTIPAGWHGVSSEGRTGFRASRVIVTE